MNNNNEAYENNMYNSQNNYGESVNNYARNGDNTYYDYGNVGKNMPNQEYGNIGNNMMNQGYGTNTYGNYGIRNYNPNMDYNPIRMWGYFGYNLLFCIPLVGFICILIFAFGGTRNINLRNYARSMFCFLILAIVVAVIVIIVVAVVGSGSHSYYGKYYW